MQLPVTDHPPLVRTAFGDDEAWRRVVVAAEAESTDGFHANIAPIDDSAFSGADPAALAAAIADGTEHAIAFVADAVTLADPDMPILCLDLLDGATTRIIPSELWGIENNVSIGNMDFADFADAADAGGVFRGF